MKFFQKPVWTQEKGFVEELQKGAHVWCHVLKAAKGVQHHGIWDGSDVYHFNKPGDDIDVYYVGEKEGRKCSRCESRRQERKDAGRGGESVRLSCVECFSHGSNVYVCKYDSGFLARMWRETGSRCTKPCLLSEDEVVTLARRFYDNNNFGKYEALTHNCEDFARFCKIEKLGCKQWTRAIFWTGLAEVSLVVRKWPEHKLKKILRN
jgi:hypothetical protein